MRHFIASVYQNGKKIKEIPLTGCSINQPYTVQGYAIPGFNKKIVVLISGKNNCFEGGYIAELLYVVGGVDVLDRSVSGNFLKGPSALLPNESNLVMYAQGTATSTPTPSGTSTSTSTVISVEQLTHESFFRRLLNWIIHFFR